VQEDDFDEEPPEEPTSKLGDIYQLGNHRLMCGDSTKAEHVAKLMDGQKAELLLTDPPYGISVVANNSVGGSKPFGDNKTGIVIKANDYAPIIGDETTETAKNAYYECKNVTKSQIIFGGNYFTDFLSPSKCWIVWDKQNTGNFADVELAWTSFDKGAKLYSFLWNGLVRGGDRKSEGIKRVHPTQKPVGLMGDILNDFTQENDNVLDVFGGSGSTLIACEQLGRKCYMMEMSPKYVDVIIKRWEEYTGKKAVKIA
jgi:DNA modification methylase